MIFGLLGLVFGLASIHLSMIEKVAITITCFIAMLIGMAVETPLVRFFEQERDVNQETDFPPPTH